LDIGSGAQTEFANIFSPTALERVCCHVVFSKKHSKKTHHPKEKRTMADQAALRVIGFTLSAITALVALMAVVTTNLGAL